jgi:aspartate aminotransferase-like enzyme
MTDDTRFGTFFLPGPTDVRAEVLAAMTRPMMPHRGAEFESLFARIQSGLKIVFGTTRPVYVSSSSATGLMEAAVRCAAPGPILSIVNGAFSKRFAQIAQACGRTVELLEIPLGQVADPSAVDDALARGSFAAVTVVHSETSTGALTDIAAIADVAHRRGAMILVDSVTGAGGIAIEADALKLDFVLTGSQKALAMPPGLAFGVASESFLHHAKAAPDRGLYFDVVEFDEYARKNQTPNTPALSLLYAADVQLQAIQAEGVDARWARHAAMREATARWTLEQQAASVPVGILAAEGARSPTVTALTLPGGVSGGDVVRKVAARGFVIGGGYGALRERTIRIGHMGDHTVDGVVSCLRACAAALGELL